jgi:hypothetical protein
VNASTLTRAVSLADDPADDDDLRLRKRVGIAIGYVAVAISLFRLVGLAAVGEDNPVIWGVSVGFATIMAANLAFVAASSRGRASRSRARPA